MKVVQTVRGLMPRDALQVSVDLEETENALVVVTTWRVKAEGPDAPHVKRDAAVAFLATPELQAQFASFEGKMVMAAPPPISEGPDVTLELVGQQAGTEQGSL